MTSMFVVDFTDYKEQSARRLTPGQHLVQVADTELTRSKAGDPMVNLTLDVISGPDKGKTFTDRLVIMDSTLFRIYGFLQALTGKKIDKKKLRLDADKWVGKQLYITVSDQENTYKGRTTIQSNVDSYSFYEGKNTIAAAKTEEPATASAPEADDNTIDVSDLDI